MKASRRGKISRFEFSNLETSQNNNGWLSEAVRAELSDKPIGGMGTAILPALLKPSDCLSWTMVFVVLGTLGSL